MWMYEIILDRLKEWLYGRPCGPVILELYPTLRCNLKCLSCEIPAMQKDIKIEVPSRRYTEIIKQAAKMGVYMLYPRRR